MAGRHAAGMSFAIALTDEQWELVADLFDPPGRRGAPAQIARRQMVDAQTVKGGRYGPTFHQAGGRGGRTIAARRAIARAQTPFARQRRHWAQTAAHAP